jgi:predicted nucleic acid-binding protein
VTTGSLQVIGQVDQVDPPHLVLPLTIEATVMPRRAFS